MGGGRLVRVDANRREQRPTKAASDRERDVNDAHRRGHPTRPFDSALWDDIHTRAWPDREVAAIASTQRGLVTHQQLVALGIGNRAIARAIARGRLHRRHRGVYSLVGPEALPPLATEQAALLACGERTHLSHHSAAAVWGIRPSSSGPVEVTIVGRDAGRRRPGVRVHRTDRIDPRDVRILKGIRITSPARTLLDIAPDLLERELERAFDEAIVRQLMTVAAARAMLLVNAHRPGAPSIRALATTDRSTTMTRSEAEERFLELMRKAGVPAPEVNVRVGRWVVDFFWRAERVVVEIDGYPYHSGRAARERDHRKDADLQDARCFVSRISARRLWHAPEEVLVGVVTALANRRRGA